MVFGRLLKIGQCTPAGDGFVVLERMRALAELAATPVTVLSARDPVENEKRALEAGLFVARTEVILLPVASLNATA
jgi:CheY-like chemotaxis protein